MNHLNSQRATCVLLSTLCFLLVLSTVAQATVRPNLRVQQTDRGRVAKAGDLGRYKFTLVAGEDLQIEPLRLTGEGWNVLGLEGTGRRMLRAGESTELSFSGIPTRVDGQLVLEVLVNGELLTYGVDLSPRAAQSLEAPLPAQQVQEPAFVPYVGSEEILPVPMADPVDYPRATGPEETEDPPRLAKAARNIRVLADIGYYRNDGAWMPADFCTVEIWENDVDPNPDDFIIAGTTNSYGIFDLTFFWDAVSEAEPDIYLVFRLDSGRTVVRNLAGGVYAWATPTTQNYAGTLLNTGSWTAGLAADYPAIHLFTNLQRSWRFLLGRGWNAPKVAGVFPDAGAPTGWYSNNEIHMSTGVQWEEDTISHEWGHHWAASFATLDNDTYCNGVCDSPSGCGHCGWCAETEKVAWNEGLANVMGDLFPKEWAAIYGQPALNIGDIYEFESLATCGGSLNAAITTEGFVAALLRDIIDNTNDNHPQYPGSDTIALGWEEVLTVVDLDTPEVVHDFLTAFTVRYPQFFTGLNLIAQDCNMADTFAPQDIAGLQSTSHSYSGWSLDTTIDYSWNKPGDIWSGVNAYDVAINPGTHAFPGFTPDLGDVTTYTTPAMLTGEWYFSVFARDRAGNWPGLYFWTGPIRVLGTDAPNLEPRVATPWPYAILPRSTTGATFDNAPVSATLPGNSAATYLNSASENTGGVTTVGTGHLNRHFVDGAQLGAAIGNGSTPAGSTWWAFDQGPFNVRGGRHTVHMDVDPNGTEPELNESDNTYGRQWIWTPLVTTPGAAYARTAPPLRSAGHNTVPAGSQTLYDNVDGFRLSVGTDFWDVFLLQPDAAVDYDLEAHFTETTGSQNGFGAQNIASTRGTGRLDAIVINRNVQEGTPDIGVLNYSGSTNSFTARHLTAPVSQVMVLGDDNSVSITPQTPMALREVQTRTGEAGIGTAYLRVDPPVAGVEFRWFGPATTRDHISGQDKYAVTDSDGLAVLDLDLTVENDYSLLMVSADPFLGLGSFEATVKLRAPLNATIVSASPDLVSVYSVPDGSGRALSEAYQWDGVVGNDPAIVDASIAVQVVQASDGTPVANFPRTDLRLTAPFVDSCTPGLYADADTDGNGDAVFSLPLRAGGTGGAAFAVELLDVPGAVVTGATNVRTNSPDINGDLRIDLIDVGEFSGNLTGAYDYRSDFVWDGVVNLKDVGVFAAALGVNCGAGGPLAKTSDEPVLEGADHLALAFDAAGRDRFASVGVGEDITAYLLLTGPAAQRGIDAWEASIETSDNVRITSSSLTSGMTDFDESAGFVVGTGTTRRADDGAPLVLATLRVRVTDAQPAHLWVRANALRSLGGDVPVISVPGAADEPNTLHPATALHATDGLPTASLNDGVPSGDAPSQVVRGAGLHNVPNPFNPRTEIRFALERSGRAEVRIYDVSGRLVRELGGRVLEAGSHALVWDGTDSDAAGVVSGVYFYRLYIDGNGSGDAQRMTLVK